MLRAECLRQRVLGKSRTDLFQAATRLWQRSVQQLHKCLHSTLASAQLQQHTNNRNNAMTSSRCSSVCPGSRISSKLISTCIETGCEAIKHAPSAWAHLQDWLRCVEVLDWLVVDVRHDNLHFVRVVHLDLTNSYPEVTNCIL